MEKCRAKNLCACMFPVVMLGAVWGIFEATVGYILHLLPIRIGFLVWYPVAVFFLIAAYRITGQKMATLVTAALAAVIKLLNLLLPGRADRVVNPAVSILFEGIAVFAAIYIFERIKTATGGRLLISVFMNTLWRALFLLYLALLVPDWMREASVLKSGGSLLRFILIDNLCSSCIVFAGLLLAAKRKPGSFKLSIPKYLSNRFVRVSAAVLLLALNITLQMAL